VRAPGGGRKPAEQLDPGLLPALLGLVKPFERGDPESPLRWVAKSTRELAGELTGAGHPVSDRTVARLLKDQGFTLQANAKVLAEGADHPDRDAQFCHINDLAAGFLTAGQPVVSVDTKKKEHLGNFANPGQSWRPAGTPVKVRDHDFYDADGPVAIPYGIYDLGANTGWVNLGRDHDTGTFAASSIRTWWLTDGIAAYPHADRLLITCDAGGSNSATNKAFKAGLAALAAETGLTITVCHFPPGASKWNRIEHRLFCHISRNWRGRPLTDHQTVLNLIGATGTTAGLRVTARLDDGDYPLGVTLSDRQLAALAIAPDPWHPEWNHTFLPQAPAGPPAAAPGPRTRRPTADVSFLRRPEILGMDAATWRDLLAAVTAAAPAPAGTSWTRRLEPWLLAAIVYQRTDLTFTALAELLGTDRKTANIRINDTLKLIAATGHRIPPVHDTRIHTLPELYRLLDWEPEATSNH
jgi:hypothetical protein